MHQKEGDRAYIRRRLLVEKYRRVPSQAVSGVLLGEEAVNGHEIAENSHTLLAGLSALREFHGSRHACADERENFELNGGFERRGPLKTVQGIEDQEGTRF